MVKTTLRPQIKTVYQLTAVVLETDSGESDDVRRSLWLSSH